MVGRKGIMDHLIMAACEWFLIFWMFIEALLAYSLTKFAKCCQLQIPCFLCSRLDHLFGNDEPGSCSYLHLLCKKHQTDISHLIYCNLHDELVDAREMCEDCSNSVSLQTRSNLECYRYKNFVTDPCSCCKSQWKKKSTGQQGVWSNVVGSRASKATTKPPLPRVARHSRSKRSKNKVKHRHSKNELSPVGQYPAVKFTSDSELEFLFSDNDDGGGYKVVGIAERSLKNEANIADQYQILGRNAHSTPDLRSAFLLEAHLNECSRARSRTRSASLTPNCLIMHNLELSRKAEEFDPSKLGKYKNSSSSMNTKTHGSAHGSLDGSQQYNRYNIFSRNSYSASDLGSAVRLEMQNNNRLRQRSASLTPNMSSNYGSGEQEWQKNSHPKVKKHKKISSNNGYGYVDDSVVSCKTSNHHNNQNMIPRRHSYSVFQLGGEILLNMPTDESQIGPLYGLEDFRQAKPHSPEPDFINVMHFPQKDDEDYTPSLPPITFIRADVPVSFIDRSKWYYGSLDDSAVTRNTGMQYKDNTPRRHSHSFFDLGCEILLNMPGDESLISTSTGYGFEQPNSLNNIQKRPNPSADSVELPKRRNKRDKKSLSSSNRTSGYESLDDLVVPFDSGFHDRNNDPRRHSYSAFELGDALLLNTQPIENSLTNHSSVTQNDGYNNGFGEPNNPGFQTMHNPSQTAVFFNKNQGYGFLDDSIVTRTHIDNHNHYQNHNKNPRRHSYSILQLGGDIILNMPHDESFAAHSFSLAPNEFIGQRFGDPQKSTFQKVEEGMNSLPPTGSVRRFSLPNDIGNDLSIDKTKWHGSFDDYLILRSQSPSQSQSDIRRRHSHSAFDLGRALLLEINLDNGLSNYHSSLAPNGSTGQGPTGHGSTGHGSTGHEHHRAHHRAKRNNSQLPPPCPMNHPLGSSSDFRNELPTFTFDTTHGIRSLDDSFFSQKTGNNNNNQYDNSNPRRHSYTAFELGCALLLNMNREASSTRRSASVTPKIQMGKESALPNFKKNEQPLTSSVNIITDDSSNTFFYKPHGYKSCDESGVSNKRDSQKRSKNLTRNYFSVSDLTSSDILEINHDEGLTRKSASLTPDCIYGQTFGELNSLKFESGPTSSHQKRKKNDRLKAKRSKRSKAKKHKKPLRKVNNVKPASTSTNALSDASYESFDDSDTYESFDDSDTYESNTDNQNRYKIFSRNSQSANDLGTSVLIETHHDDRSRNRSKSLTPNCSYYSDDSVQFVPKKREQKHHTEVEKDKKQLPPTYPTKEMDSSSNRPDLCPSCLDKIDLRSLDGSIASEYDYECGIQKVKQQAEDDVRCMRLLQSELEAERNAATVAANHAMNMITRLQQEKASLQMEALQYLRMMEEQAEYDMEALQKANELVEEKENEIQDLLNELEQYRNKYGDEPINDIKSFDEERSYILESLSKLEKKINQLVNRADEKSTESETYVDFSKLENEILELKMKMEALQADLDLVKHVCNTLHANEGLEFIQEIAHQLKDMRKIVFDKRLISSN